MTTTVISTNTTNGINLALVGDGLVVTQSGSIVNPIADIAGKDLTGQFVTIAGLVEMRFIWMGGADTINISSSGIFNGHSTGTSIFIGTNSSQTVTHGHSTLNNQGEISATFDGVEFFSTNNVLTNSGSIFAQNVAINMGSGDANSVVNSGLISTTNVGVILGGFFCSLTNSGIISSAVGITVELNGQEENLTNTGSISGNLQETINLTGGNETLVNQGSITNSIGTSLSIHALGNVVTNSGTISANGIAVFVVSGGNMELTNSGQITANQQAISLQASQVGDASTITNTGTISGLGHSVVSAAGNETLNNFGLLKGDVDLGGGNDIFDGRGGAVIGTVTAGAGDDIYFVDNASLVLTELATLGETDSVFSEVNYRLFANFENLTLLNANNLNGTGNDSNNLITGNAGDNRLNGLDGFDTLNGDTGNDRLNGGIQNDSLNGGDGDDTLNGQSENDVLIGGDGDDLLIGGRGKDVLTGGNGADVFQFTAIFHSSPAQVNADIITDFLPGEDLINLSGIDANRGNSGANDVFVFIGAGPFTGVAGQLHYIQSGGNTYIEMDVNGDMLADSAIRLNGLFTLSGGDFVL